MTIPLAIDLFGCGGGMTLAMLMAGFHVVASVDKDAQWEQIIRMNFGGIDRLLPQCPIVIPVTADLLRITPQQVADIVGFRLADIRWIHASCPCQHHSYAGFRVRESEDHDTLLVPCLWAEACPDAFITVENVRGVEDSYRFRESIERLRINRETCWFTVNANWYGVAQNRRRVWIVSAPPGKPCLPPPPPTVVLPRDWTWAMQSPRDIMLVDDNRFPSLHKDHRDILPFVPEGCTSREIVYAPAKKWVEEHYSRLPNFIRRLPANRPVTTVMTAVYIRNILKHCHPWSNRPSTVREMARFQDFPDEFILPASLTNAYRMIGEAVPIGMGLAWARQIILALGEDYHMSDGGILLPSRPDLNLCAQDCSKDGIGNAVAPPMAEAFAREIMHELKSAHSLLP